MSQTTTTSFFDAIAEKSQASAESRKYYHDPVGFLERYIDWPAGSSLADYQQNAMRKVVEKRRAAIRSAHGGGKTTIASLMAIWFALSREVAGVDWKVLTTATAWRHLTLYLWPEINKWLKRVKWDELGLPEPQRRTQWLDLRLKLAHGAASAIASDDPVNLEGAHADSILYVFDEAKAIPNATWDAAEGALSGAGEDTGGPQPLEAYALAISTPGPPAGRFYDIHARKPGLEDWHAIHVTLEDAIRAKRIARSWAKQRAALWGEESAIYRNRVLGEFHSADEDAVIPLSWIEQANDRFEQWKRDGEPREGRKIVSVDVARTGSDFTVITTRYGNVVTQIKRHKFADTMRTASEVIKHVDDDTLVIVDSIGVGAGVIDRLRELKIKVRAHTGSAKTHLTDRSKEFGFANARTAAYWMLREALDPAFEPELALPPDDQLTGDLTAPKYSYTTGVPPKLKLETKEDLTARIGRSPDVGDACFVAGTLIATEHGDQPIEDVRPGTRVWTRSGLREVTTAGCTKHDAEVMTVELADGRSITGTPEHPVWDGREFRPLHAFAMTDSMWVCEKSGSLTVESSSPGTPMPNGASIGSTTGRRNGTGNRVSGRFMSRSTKQKSATSLMAGMFITATAILSTIAPKILRHSRRTAMPSVMRVNVADGGDSTTSTWSACVRWPKRGTRLRRGGHGIPGTGSERGRGVSASPPARASDAVSRSSRTTSPGAVSAGGAPVTATTSGTTATEFSGSTRHVPDAGSSSGPSGTRLSTAPVAVLRSYASATSDVWNLEVEGEHEYFANGILVHNCAMSVLETRMSGQSTVVVPGSHSPSNSHQESDEGRSDADLHERGEATPPPVTRTGNVNKAKSKRITRISPLDAGSRR